MCCVHSVVLLPASRKRPPLRHLLRNSARPHCAGSASCVAPLARLPCASLVTPPHRALRLETRAPVCSVRKPPSGDRPNTPPPRLRLNLTTAPFPVRTARTTPPLHPSLCFKTHMRCVLRFPPCRAVSLPYCRLLGTKNPSGRPSLAASTSRMLQPRDGVASSSNGFNYASASPFPVFQNAYALRTHCSALCPPVGPASSVLPLPDTLSNTRASCFPARARPRYAAAYPAQNPPLPPTHLLLAVPQPCPKLTALSAPRTCLHSF